MSHQADQPVTPQKRRRLENENGPSRVVQPEKGIAKDKQIYHFAKVVNDSVHGHLELSSTCVAVIDTKQFQRLRFIKQTGFCYFVYPGASHNRFEHSLGTCYLAGQLATTLRNNQPELKIDEKDILCVELAGLCHDLGHGPFSHAFDGKFIPMVNKTGTWKHERASLDMLDYLIEENGLMGENGALTQSGINEQDIIFIKEMIYGLLEQQNLKKDKPEEMAAADIPKPIRNEQFMSDLLETTITYSVAGQERLTRIHGHTLQGEGRFDRVPDLVVWPEDHKKAVKVLELATKYNVAVIPFGVGTRGSLEENRMIVYLDTSKMDWRYIGRPKNKAFLYQIVSNKRTGIDVDKWDYFARDCHHLGIRNNFDHRRFVKFIRVLHVNDRLEICARDKEIGNLYQMFYTRYTLHRSAYQHKVNCAIEIMMVDALLKANDHLFFQGNKGRNLKLSQCIFDMEAYLKVTDHILWEIFCNQRPEMQDAQRIVERILNRDLYRCLDERLMSDKLLNAIREKKINENGLRDELIKTSKSDAAKKALDKADFRLQIVYLDFGMKDSNPLENLMYYSKSDPDTPKSKNEKGLLKPPRFKDSLIRVYSCKKSPEIEDQIRFCFEALCKKWKMEEISNVWDFSVYSTPEKPSTSREDSGTPCTAGKSKGRLSSLE